MLAVVLCYKDNKLPVLGTEPGECIMGYRTIKSRAEDRFIEKKSRFTGYAAPAQTPEEARAFIAEIKQRHWDATHNVWAYLLKDGQKRYSDDGEPQCTAGIPVLEVLEKSGVVDVCVVATRYFGGILLGGGGLVRAYSHTARIALDAAEILEMTECRELLLTVDYSLYGKLSYLLPDYEIKTLDSDFGAEITLRLLIKSSLFSAFEKAFRELTNGKYGITVVTEKYDFF